jgi:hypothetical protein
MIEFMKLMDINYTETGLVRGVSEDIVLYNIDLIWKKNVLMQSNEK